MSLRIHSPSGGLPSGGLPKRVVVYQKEWRFAKINGCLTIFFGPAVDHRPNSDALRKCILEGPYTLTTVVVPVVPTTENSLAVLEQTIVEIILNMSPTNKAHFESEKEAIHLILTGIRDEIYLTVDASQLKRQYDRRVNKRPMQMQESKVVSSKALDASLVVTECRGTKSDEHITSSSLGTYITQVVDADIRPVNDQVPSAEVHLTAHKFLANEQQHIDQFEPSYDTYLLEKVDSNTTPDSTNMSHRGGEIDQDAEQDQVKSPLLKAEFLKMNDMVEKEVYNELSNRFLQLEKHCISLEISMQQKEESFQSNKPCKNQESPEFHEFFEINDLKAQLQAKTTLICNLKNQIKSVKEASNEAKLKKEINVLETINIELESRIVKKNCMVLNDMDHNHYLEEARKKTQERNRNSKPSVMHTTSLQNTTNGSKPNPRSNNQISRSLPVSKSSCGMSNGVSLTRNNNKPVEPKSRTQKPSRQIAIGQRFSLNKSSVVPEKPNIPRSCLRWIPTGRIFKLAGLRPNGDALRKFIIEGPYTPTTVVVPAVPVIENSLAVLEQTTVETILNMSPANKAHFESEKEAIHLILTRIGDEIYSTVDACKTAQEIWEAIERLQQGESLNIQDVKTNLFWEFGQFTSHNGETIKSYYTRFYKMMNEMIRNNLTVATMQVNVQFLQQLQPEWSRFVTIVKQQHKLDEVSYHKLFDILKQYQKEVNELRYERMAKNANPLALVATAQTLQDSYYQTSKSHKSYTPTSKASLPSRSHATTRHKGKEIAKPITPPSESASEEDSDPEQAQKNKDMQKNLALIAKYFKKLYKPTNNNLRTSSNTRNKNVDTTPRYKNDN
ncbi:hypothetical protein Tco_0815741 [Tanacetum coccineum]